MNKIPELIEWRGHAWLCLPARLYLGWVFIYACLHKIAHPGVFALDIATYNMLPLSLINLMAIILPYLELVAGAMLIVGFRVKAGALLVSAMMVIFVIAVSYALYQGLDTSCGCFASQAMEDDPIGAHTILRDVGWLLLGLYVMFFDRRPLGVDRLFAPRERSAADA